MPAIQGPLLAFLPLEFAIVRERAGERAGRAIGLLVGALAIGGSLGLLLAGVARQFLSLPATLWIPAVLMIVTVPVAALLVPETTARTPGRIDWAGAGLLSLGLVLLLAAVGNGSTWGWTDARTVGGVLAGLGSLATAAGYLLTALAHGSVGGFVVWQILVGVGNGLVLVALSTHVVTHAPVDAVGISSGLFNTARTVGGAVSGAAFAAVMAALLIRLPSVATPVTSEAGYVTVWLACAALAATVSGIALRMDRLRDGQAARAGHPRSSTSQAKQ